MGISINKLTKRTKRNQRRQRQVQGQENESNLLYNSVQQKAANRVAEQDALRRFEVTGGDETAIGCKSSGWPEYKIVLTERLRGLAASKVTKADQSARVFNAVGFKTGSGQTWTPRLINVAKFLLFGLLADRIVEEAPSKHGAKPNAPSPHKE